VNAPSNSSNVTNLREHEKEPSIFEEKGDIEEIF
jgi:hypothetical protein